MERNKSIGIGEEIIKSDGGQFLIHGHTILKSHAASTPPSWEEVTAHRASQLIRFGQWQVKPSERTVQPSRKFCATIQLRIAPWRKLASRVPTASFIDDSQLRLGFVYQIPHNHLVIGG